MTEEREIKKEDFCANFFTQTYRGGADTVTPPFNMDRGYPPPLLWTNPTGRRGAAPIFFPTFSFFRASVAS